MCYTVKKQQQQQLRKKGHQRLPLRLFHVIYHHSKEEQPSVGHKALKRSQGHSLLMMTFDNDTHTHIHSPMRQSLTKVNQPRIKFVLGSSSYQTILFPPFSDVVSKQFFLSSIFYIELTFLPIFNFFLFSYTLDELQSQRQLFVILYEMQFGWLGITFVIYIFLKDEQESLYWGQVFYY